MICCFFQSQAPRQEGEEKENVPELSKMEEEEEGRNEESKVESRMEVDKFNMFIFRFLLFLYHAVDFSTEILIFLCMMSNFLIFVEFSGISEIM